MSKSWRILTAVSNGFRSRAENENTAILFYKPASNTRRLTIGEKGYLSCGNWRYSLNEKPFGSNPSVSFNLLEGIRMLVEAKSLVSAEYQVENIGEEVVVRIILTTANPIHELKSYLHSLKSRLARYIGTAQVNSLSTETQFEHRAITRIVMAQQGE